MADDAEVLFGDWLVRLKQAAQNPITTLKRIGALVTSRSQKRFATQTDPEGKAWPARMNPNIPGILDDLERGASVKARRWEGRPALVDYGSMRQSINWRLIATDTVEIGTPDPRAKMHHFGLERVIPITQAMKDGLREMLSKFRRKAKRHWAAAPGFTDDPSRLAFLLHRDEYKFKLIRRQFIGLDAQDEEDVREIIRNNFLGDAIRESTK